MHVCNDPAHARLARNVEKVKQKLADTSKLIALYNDAKAQLGSQGQQLAALRAERARLEKERAEHSDERTRLERVNRELEQRRCDDEKTQLRRVQEKEKEIQQQKGEVERVRREGEKLQEQLAAKTRALQQLQADGGGGGRPAPPALLVASPAPAAAPLLAQLATVYERLRATSEISNALDLMQGIYHGSSLLAVGHAVHEAAHEAAKPDAERETAYRERNLPFLVKRLAKRLADLHPPHEAALIRRAGDLLRANPNPSPHPST